MGELTNACVCGLVSPVTISDQMDANAPPYHTLLRITAQEYIGKPSPLTSMSVWKR